MSIEGKWRAAGAAVIVANLALIGHFDLGNIPILLLTFGFAIGYELLVVRKEAANRPAMAFLLIGLCVIVIFFGASANRASRTTGSQERQAPVIGPDPNPFAEFAPLAHVGQAEQSWEAEIRRWEQNNADFLADPSRRKVMEDTLATIEANMPGLDNSSLIIEAERVAFFITGWPGVPSLDSIYSGSTSIVDPFNPEPAQSPSKEARSEQSHEAIVDRGLFGRCPAGYVDHPNDPSKCVVPALAERHYRRTR